MAKRKSFFAASIDILKQTVGEWTRDKVPQLGAGLAYYTVFSLAPLVLVVLGLVGVIFRSDPAGAWERIISLLGYVLDSNSLSVIQDIARKASHPEQSVLAAAGGMALALFGASGVFGQLQDALNTIWGVKPPEHSGIWDFVKARFLSFAMVAGVCFLLLVSLAIETVLKAFSQYVQSQMPGGLALALVAYWIFDFAVVVVLFAGIYKFLPDLKLAWRDVWVGAVLTAILFAIGKWALSFYLGSGGAGSAYGAAGSLVTLLLWVYYSSQILLFGAELTQVQAQYFGKQAAQHKRAVKHAQTRMERAKAEAQT